ncbi:MAG: DUF4465 domain-containing protein [Muribaculaceae bacterium]|nr:DUF4465 domain-containing protein [Muribaculaceae bacterium]
MKKILLFLAVAAQATCLSAQSTDDEFLILTFEDADYKGDENFVGECNWSSLISDPQYGGELLYGPEGWGVMEIEKAYWWCDENNTWLFNRLSEGYGSWCYWSGGHAISNYGSADIEQFGGFESQLTVYNGNADMDLTTSGNGHNGSDNFAVQFGYSDNSGFGLSEESLPFLEFKDGVARVIDHMYVTNTTYALNCYLNGNSLTANIGEDDWVKIVAKGYLNGEVTGTAEFYLCDGPENIVTDWTKFDLYDLGLVEKVTFNIKGSSDNGYGFSQPAYFAYDDVAVRKNANADDNTSGVENIATDNSDADATIYDLYGRAYSDRSNLRPGLYIINGKKQLVK